MKRKLFVYAAGAITASAGVKAANASLVITPLNTTVPHDGYTDVTADGTAVKDFDVANNTDGVWLKNNKSGIAYAAATTAPGSIAPVTTGSVDSTLTYSAAASTVYLTNTATHGNTTPFPTDGSTQYVGFEIPASGGGFNYGDLALTISADPANAGDFITTLIETRYDTTVNEAVPTSSVPEPSSLMILALGSLSAFRRKR